MVSQDSSKYGSSIAVAPKPANTTNPDGSKSIRPSGGDTLEIRDKNTGQLIKPGVTGSTRSSPFPGGVPSGYDRIENITPEQANKILNSKADVNQEQSKNDTGFMITQVSTLNNVQTTRAATAKDLGMTGLNDLNSPAVERLPEQELTAQQLRSKSASFTPISSGIDAFFKGSMEARNKPNPFFLDTQADYLGKNPLSDTFGNIANFITGNAVPTAVGISEGLSVYGGSVYESKYYSLKARQKGLIDRLPIGASDVGLNFSKSSIESEGRVANVTGQVVTQAAPYFLGTPIALSKSIIDIAATPNKQVVAENFVVGGALGGGITLAEYGSKFLPGPAKVPTQLALKYGVPIALTGLAASSFIQQGEVIYGQDKDASKEAIKDIFGGFGAGYIGASVGGFIVKTPIENLKFIGTPEVKSTEVTDVYSLQQQATNIKPYYRPIENYNATAPSRIVEQFNQGEYAKNFGLDRAGFHVTVADVGKEFKVQATLAGKSKYGEVPGTLFISDRASLPFLKLKQGLSESRTSFFGEIPGSPKITILEDVVGTRQPIEVRPKFGKSNAADIQRSREFLASNKTQPNVGYTSTLSEGGLKAEYELVIAKGDYERATGVGLFGQLTGYTGFTRIKTVGPLGIPFETKVGITRLKPRQTANVSEILELNSINRSRKSNANIEKVQEEYFGRSDRIIKSGSIVSGRSSSYDIFSVISSIYGDSSVSGKGSSRRGGSSENIISSSFKEGGSSSFRIIEDKFYRVPSEVIERRDTRRFNEDFLIPKNSGSFGGLLDQELRGNEKRKIYNELDISLLRLGFNKVLKGRKA